MVAQDLTAKGGGQKENPMRGKHYVYSARTTEQGLALLNEARRERGWDAFVNEAVAKHYGLDLSVITLPPSKFLIEREEKRKTKGKAAGKRTQAKVDRPDRKASEETGRGADGLRERLGGQGGSRAAGKRQK